jgi:hypothetical protein
MIRMTGDDYFCASLRVILRLGEGGEEVVTDFSWTRRNKRWLSVVEQVGLLALCAFVLHTDVNPITRDKRN